VPQLSVADEERPSGTPQTWLAAVQRATFRGSPAMKKMVERVMQILGLWQGPEEEDTREVLLDFLSKKPGAEQYGAEHLNFLKDLRT
jgi:hypothetical protein